MIDRFDGEWRFLSNFTLCDVRPPWWPHSLPPFPTVEHGFQACKVDAEMVGAHEWLGMVEKIRVAETPGRAKRLGQAVPLHPQWEQIKIGMMEHLLRQKFSSGGFDRQLLSTNGHVLVEGNTWGDTFWGVCKGEGRNELGKLLMRLRQEMMDQGWLDRW